MPLNKALRGITEPYSCICCYSRQKRWRLDAHVHPFFQFLLVTGGTVELFYDNSCHICGKGDLSIIPPGFKHALFTSEGYTQVGFDLLPVKDQRGITQILENNVNVPVIIKKYYLLDSIHELSFISDNYSLLSRLKIASILDNVILAVLEDISPESNKEIETKLFNILQRDFSEKINLSMITKELAVSKTQLERLTSKRFGCGVIEMHNHLRISKACTYLQDNNISIKEISEMLGFCDQAHFNRFFKSRTKYTPVQYRNQKHHL